MIAFDLDGVLVSDLVFMGAANDFARMVLASARDLAEPIFQPTGEYGVVTARANALSASGWLVSRLNPQPTFVEFYPAEMDRSLGIVARWKVSMCERHGVTVFVESDPMIAALMRECRPDVRVVVFSELVLRGLDELL